jgi:hypothetical protein
VKLTRDSIILRLAFFASVLTFMVSSTTTLIPVDYVPYAKDLAAVFGFVAGYLGTSPLPGAGK